MLQHQHLPAARQHRVGREVGNGQLRQRGDEAALDQRLAVAVEHAHEGHGRVRADAVEDLLERRLVRRVQAVFRELRHHADQRHALRLQLLFVVAPALVEVVRRDGDGGQEDEPDGQ